MNRKIKIFIVLSLCFSSFVQAKEVNYLVESVAMCIEVLDQNLQTRDEQWIKNNLVASNVNSMTGRVIVSLLFEDQVNFRFSCHGIGDNYHCDSVAENTPFFEKLEDKDNV